MNWKDGLCVGLALVFLLLMMKQMVYLQQLQVRIKKTRAETGIIVLALAVLAVLAGLVCWKIGARPPQLAMGVFAAALLLTDWQKQGLAAEGLLTFQRGREFYPWQQLSRVEMVQGETIKLTFYTAQGQALITHDYKAADLPQTRAILAASGLPVQIKKVKVGYDGT